MEDENINAKEETEQLTEEKVISLFNELMSEKQEEIVPSTVELVKDKLESIVDEKLNKEPETDNEGAEAEEKANTPPQKEDEDVDKEDEEEKQKSLSEIIRKAVVMERRLNNNKYNYLMERAKTNRLMLKYLDIDLNAAPITSEEARILKLLDDNFNKQAYKYVEWLQSDEARKATINQSMRESEIFENIREDIREIYHQTSRDVNEVIERIYNVGEAKGYNDIRQRRVYTEASRYALTFLKDYNFELIKNVSNDFINTIQEEIFVGMASDLHPSQIATNIMDSKNKVPPTKTLTPAQRAGMIARTETARAQTTGTLQAYANYGVKEIDVIHSDDGRVCKTCLENKAHNPHPIKDSIDLCPAHPNCRCAVSAHIKHGAELKPQDPIPIITSRRETLENWFFEFDGLEYHLKGNNKKSRLDFLNEYNVSHSGIKEEYLNFLKLYTGSGAAYINGYLRGLMTKEESRKEWEDYANEKELYVSFDRVLEIKDRIFEKYGVTLEENIMVCRRENNRYVVVGDDGTYTDKGFLSTSIYENAKKETYGDELNFILIPKGTKIIYLEGITLADGDFEILLPPSTELKFITNYTIDQKIWTI